MRWYHSLFLKIFLWFWCVIFLAMGAAVFTYEWIGNDYLRPATQREVALLVDQMEHERPVIAEGRRLWRSLRPGWNLVAAPVDAVSQLPHDLEEFADQAANRREVLWGQNDGWVMVGPLQYDGYLYLSVTRTELHNVLDNEHRWLVPLTVILVVTLLCFLLVWNLTRPIRRLRSTVRQLGRGNFDVSGLEADLHRHDEIGTLANDVADMADALQRLLHSHQQLLRDVSHELRSPLTRLQIALGIARKKDTHQTLAAEHQRIERAVEQVDSLISDILDLARLRQANNSTLQTEKLSVSAQVGIWLQDAALEISQKSLVLETYLPAAEVKASWEWMLVERAFDNLLRNAIRFSPADSVLRVGAAQRGDEIELWVADSGPGVAEEDLQRIFDAFVQVDTARSHTHSRSQSSGGYGIGLALVKRIVELHDGKITAENIHPGLRVTMRLPKHIRS
ncbi:MAG: hypothetical protein CMI08_08910 [Oceanospirillaceae bacterium]|uniref:HAMP domain-containing sensor histidine kinase n=1 Tax=unclassified Thalassolituus TaxID=2624967 RepID=UPI000C0A5D4B|nr:MULTISPECIES: ATP-binding protein [unclassified Thalassolituus]MAK91004.1 hypothetical protein [Thalassolituus sp.]MAS25804.1 hypothetical protein [Oceanospirillaceae bacterium]MAX99311.1 hypothetical protein [Oceanospirillaceae bacterium]MBS51286.1 hypothetical protein [Oceanospirillaceae bacterium]|tara:strand:+ start:7427 stop:8776 length:1350 start_codon:yes stop_codon:yes gene_type:complete